MTLSGRLVDSGKSHSKSLLDRLPDVLKRLSAYIAEIVIYYPWLTLYIYIDIDPDRESKIN